MNRVHILLIIIFSILYMIKRLNTMTAKEFIENTRPFPGYFFSHGGPTFMYRDQQGCDKGAWDTIKGIGKEIKNNWKPDYIIVVSAHWQARENNCIEIGVPPSADGENELVYDFYNFPDYMYKEQFRTQNSEIITESVASELKKGGFNVKLTRRGIDHGVWVPFKIAFSDYTQKSGKKPDGDILDLPDTKLIQVSLPSDEEDFDSIYKLGKALSRLRSSLVWSPQENRYLKGMVVASGMSVHNLHDFRSAFRSGYIREMPYTKPFNSRLTNIVTSPGLGVESFKDLKRSHRDLLYKAHPTLEHFVPIIVAAGLVEGQNEPVKELYNSEMGSLGWGIYQFGDDYKS